MFRLTALMFVCFLREKSKWNITTCDMFRFYFCDCYICYCLLLLLLSLSLSLLSQVVLIAVLTYY